MADISVQNIVKAFEEGKNILDGLTFDVLEGEHIGILGSNGTGKTTLFRLLTGQLYPDEGEIVIASGKRLGLISQIPVYPEGYTAEDVLKTAHKRVYELGDEMRRLEAEMAVSSDEALLRRYDSVSNRYMDLGGYELERHRNTVANGLGIPQHQREQLFDTLSGGEKTRINLARLILENTDILLLDEPTNHLDMNATEWLEDYVTKFKGTVLTISHDRYFLDKTAQRTIEIVNGKAEFYPGNYSFFVEEKERRLLEQQKKYEKSQTEIKRLQQSADRLYQWGTGNKRLMRKSFAIQSRIERIEKIERPKYEKKMKVKFTEKTFMGDEVCVISGLSKAYGEKRLFTDVEMMIVPGERIAIVGDNGTGKSTFLKILMNEVRADSGIFRTGPAVKTAYLPQIIKFEHPERSVLDTLIYDENCTPQSARNRLGAFKFSGDDVFTQVSQLSGGEQSRLRLCILMKDNINFLILDEPTNHLDIDSREWIEEALEDYEETLLFVSHDRYFINRFATRVWEFKDGKITDYRCSFERYQELKAVQEAREQIEKRAEKQDKPKIKEKKASPANTEKKIARLEKEIAVLEEKMTELDRLSEENASDYTKLMELDEEKAEINSRLEEKYELWEELSQSV